MTPQHRPNTHRRVQRGVTLIVALILLTALGLVAASALRAGTANMRIVDNTRARQQALSAAQSAIETTISTTSFATDPNGVANKAVPVDLDGDGTVDLSARISPAPACYRARPVPLAELDPAAASDRNCMGSSAAAHTGIEGASVSSNLSQCADSEWNIRAEVIDTNTNAVAQVNQGVAVRTLITEAQTSCP